MKRTLILTLVIVSAFTTPQSALAELVTPEPNNIVLTPNFSPDGGTYNAVQYVQVTCGTSGATIHFTTNGADPNESDPSFESWDSIYVDHDMTLKAAAWGTGRTPSAVRSAVYTFVCLAPQFSLDSGTFYGPRNVMITCPTPGATIRYTLNGMDPTESDPRYYSGQSLLLDHSVTLKARAWYGVWPASEVKTAQYTFAAATYSGGSGTEADPYIIATKADIMQLSGTGGVCGKNFLMTADIDLTGEVFSGAVVPSITACTFDGGGHKIIGFIIDDGGAGKSNLGFFGSSNYSRILRLTIENCSVSGSTNSQYVGGLAGSFGGGCISTDAPSNCTSKPRLRAPIISDCHVSGGVVYGWENVGGLVGSVGDTVIQCSSTAAVTGTYRRIGGLIGHVYNSNVQNCYAGGPVIGPASVGGVSTSVGGLIGHLYSSNAQIGYDFYGSILRCCYSTGHVSGGQYRGGGGLVGTRSNPGDGRIVACFWDTQTSGTTYSDGGTGKTTAQMKDINTFLVAGWDFAAETANGLADYWKMSAGGYPALYAMPTPAGQGTVTDPYIVTTVDELLRINHWPWASFELGNDVDMIGRVFNKAPIAPDPEPAWRYGGTLVYPYDRIAFCGVLDGKCHKITGLTITDGGVGNGYFGLFGQILDGTVKRLTLENCTITGAEGVFGQPEGSWYVGAIAGAVGLSNIEDCSSSGTVIGRRYVGGLAGKNTGSNVARCSSAVNVSGAVGTNLGGLIGHNTNALGVNLGPCSPFIIIDLPLPTPPPIYGNLTDCYARGAVTGRGVGGLAGFNEGKVTRCYSTGLTTGSAGAYGLVYTSGSGATTTDSFWDTQTSGQATSVGGTGKTTAEMMSQSTFVGWDFASVWTIDEGVSYPRFVSDVPKADAGGDQTITVPYGGKAVVTLDGSGSLGPDCRLLTYLWAGIIDGVPFASTEATPIAELAPGTYVFALVVNNGLMDSEPNTCTVTVIENQLPIAEAGLDQVLYADHTGKATASLDGMASSDPEGKPLSYLWSWNVAGADCNSTDPNFTTQLPVGEYPFSLIVNDGLDSSLPDTCTISIIAPVRAKLMMVPRVLNAQAHNKDIAAIFTIPGVTRADLDPSAPITLWPFGIQAKRKMVFAVRDGLTIMVFFDTEEIIASTPRTSILRVQVETKLKDGRYAVGSDYCLVLQPPRPRR